MLSQAEAEAEPSEAVAEVPAVCFKEQPLRRPQAATTPSQSGAEVLRRPKEVRLYSAHLLALVAEAAEHLPQTAETAAVVEAEAVLQPRGLAALLRQARATKAATTIRHSSFPLRAEVAQVRRAQT